MLKFNKIFINFLTLNCLLFSSFAASAAPRLVHRFHTSLTRIDYNRDQKLFEISIQLFTHDLVPLLEQKTGSHVELEKTPGVDAAIMKYLNENFALADKNGNAKTLRWVGKEMDVDSIWIYVETASDETPEGYNLQNTIFFESFPEQTNLVICRYDGKKADLMFKAGDKIKEILENKSPVEN